MKYVKSFDILGIDTAQIPCIELHGVPNSATFGVVGMLGIDVDSESHDLYMCVAVNGAIYTWKCVKDGKDGVCVRKSEINDNGELILTLSDGSTLNSGVVKGRDGTDGLDGAKGQDGVGITNIETNERGELVVTLSNGETINAGKVCGSNGENGVGITKVEITPNFELIVTFSNDTMVNLGSIKSEHTATADTTSGVTELNKGDIMRLFVGTTDEWDEYDGAKENVVAAFTDDPINDLVNVLSNKVKAEGGEAQDFSLSCKKRLWSGEEALSPNGLFKLGGIARHLNVGDKVEIRLKRNVSWGSLGSDIFHYIVEGFVQYENNVTKGIKLNDYSYKDEFSIVCSADISSGELLLTFNPTLDIESITITDIYKIVE